MFDTEADIYNKNGISFESLQHLESLGLIHFDHISGFIRTGLSGGGYVRHGSRKLLLNFGEQKDAPLYIGYARFTQIGKELLRLAHAPVVEGFYEYVAEKWAEWIPSDK